MKKTAIIIGAGPAGLTAAYELLKRTDIIPVIIEQSQFVGGISKTYNYKGNHIDLGGHRFFSKSDRVMDWWLDILPLQKITDSAGIIIPYHNKEQLMGLQEKAPDPERSDKVMLLRKRLSRIYYNRRFFDYPVKLNGNTFSNLGIIKMMAIAFSYFRATIIKRKPELTLEDFFINRFGKKLYETFFKDYTEKVWGVPCNKISADWGAQRVKGLSAFKAVMHAIGSIFRVRKSKVETTLIEQFLYPKFGPGMLWQNVADEIVKGGGKIIFNAKAETVHTEGKQIKGLTWINKENGKPEYSDCDFAFSTMPVKDLIAGWQGDVPADVKETAAGLVYRDFISVGLLFSSLKKDLPDNWIYIQEPDVKMGRIQVFNNWSPYMVKDKNNFWLGLEYFCNEGDEMWTMPDDKMLGMASSELEKIGIADKTCLLDGVVLREAKTYPAYFGSYNNFDLVKNFTSGFENLFLIGRNGMHKYNNQDHSMLTAMIAVDNIISGISDKKNIWDVNTEQDYHEEKASNQ